MMIRRILCFVCILETLGTADSCVEEEDITSALQVSQLQDRSVHRRSKRAVEGSVEQVVAAKGSKNVDGTTNGKSGKRAD